MQEHWAEKYISIPWKTGGRDMSGFDCFGLFFWIQVHEFGNLNIPQYQYDFFSLNNKCKKLKTVLETEWHEIKKPFEGCAVLMSTNRIFHHIGTYLAIDGGLVLHAADKQKVIAQSVLALKQKGYRRISFFQHGSHS